MNVVELSLFYMYSVGNSITSTNSHCIDPAFSDYVAFLITQSYFFLCSSAILLASTAAVL